MIPILKLDKTNSTLLHKYKTHRRQDPIFMTIFIVSSIDFQDIPGWVTVAGKQKIMAFSICCSPYKLDFVRINFLSKVFKNGTEYD